MDILQDIKDILVKNKDKEHHLRIDISWDGVTVYLEYDPEKSFEENCIIPIRYETLESFAYIPNDEYREKYNPTDYGIDLKEIVLIKEIMEYLKTHSQQIDELCKEYDWEYREVENTDDNDLQEESVDYEDLYRKGCEEICKTVENFDSWAVKK